MFSRVQREARQETSKLLPPKVNKNVEKKSSNEKLAPENKPTKRSAPDKESAKKAPKRDLETVNLSEESRQLIAEMDMLNSTGSSMEALPSSIQSASSSKFKNAGPVKQTKSTSKRGGRSRRGKKSVPEEHVVDDSDDDSVQHFNASFDDSQEILVDPIVTELYTVRVRWKNEVLRFKVPPVSA